MHTNPTRSATRPATEHPSCIGQGTKRQAQTNQPAATANAAPSAFEATCRLNDLPYDILDRLPLSPGSLENLSRANQDLRAWAERPGVRVQAWQRLLHGKPSRIKEFQAAVLLGARGEMMYLPVLGHLVTSPGTYPLAARHAAEALRTLAMLFPDKHNDIVPLLKHAAAFGADREGRTAAAQGLDVLRGGMSPSALKSLAFRSGAQSSAQGAVRALGALLREQPAVKEKARAALTAIAANSTHVAACREAKALLALSTEA